MKFELKNIKELEAEEAFFDATVNDFLINVVFEQLVFSANYEFLLTNFSSETVAEASSNS